MRPCYPPHFLNPGYAPATVAYGHQEDTNQAKTAAQQALLHCYQYNYTMHYQCHCILSSSSASDLSVNSPTSLQLQPTPQWGIHIIENICKGSIA